MMKCPFYGWQMLLYIMIHKKFLCDKIYIYVYILLYKYKTSIIIQNINLLHFTLF